ncbi:MAG: hypothetical protein MUE33_05160 [Cytophagaceae bacterium]|nr:hypothetical protein [Cytophagaceae bacterium]
MPSLAPVSIVLRLFCILLYVCSFSTLGQTTSDDQAVVRSNDGIFQTSHRMAFTVPDERSTFEMTFTPNWNQEYPGLIATDRARFTAQLGYHRLIESAWGYGMQSRLHWVYNNNGNGIQYALLQNQWYGQHISYIGKFNLYKQAYIVHQYFGKNTLNGSTRRPAEGKFMLRIVLTRSFSLSRSLGLITQANTYFAWQINWNQDNALYNYKNRFIDQTQWQLQCGVMWKQQLYIGVYGSITTNYIKTAAAVDPITNTRNPFFGITTLFYFSSDKIEKLNIHPITYW